MKRLVPLLLGLLPPAEREFVWGDLIERQASPLIALHSIVVLAFRLQLREWRRPGPWFAIIFIAILAGYNLSEALARLCNSIILPFDVWRHYNIVFQPGGVAPWQQLTWSALWLLAVTLTLWSCGRLLSLLSGRALWFTALAFYVMLTDSWFIRMALRGDVLLRHPLWIDALLRLIPLHLNAAILLPALVLGMRRPGASTLATLRAALFIPAAVLLALLLTAMSTWFDNGYADWSGQPYRAEPYLRRLLPILAILWPLLFFPFLHAFAKHRRRPVAT